MLKNIVINTLIKIECLVSLAVGGSRSRNNFDEKSDWDIFCLIKDDEFDIFKLNLPTILRKVEKFIIFDYSSFQLGWGFLFYGITEKGIQYDIAILPTSMASYMGIRNTNIVLKDDSGIYADFMSKETAKDKNIWTSVVKNTEMKKSQFLFNVARYINSINKNNLLLAHRYIGAMKVDICTLYRLINNLKTAVIEIPEKDLCQGDFIYDSLIKVMVFDANSESLNTIFLNMVQIYINLTGDKKRISLIINKLSSQEND